MKKLIVTLLSLVMIVVISGCSSHHEIKIDKSYVAYKDTKVQVDKIKDKTGVKQTLDIENMLKIAFEKQLQSNNLLADANSNIKCNFHLI